MMAQKSNLPKNVELTSLTEFEVITPENPPSTNTFFSKLFRRKKSESEVSAAQEPSEEPKITSSSYNDNEQGNATFENSAQSKDMDSNSSSADPSISFCVSDFSGTRSLANVLKRVRNILDRRSLTPQAYKDSDFKQYWMPDSNCRECYECGDKFNTFRRRHHCRVCGQIFCRRCCNQEIPGKIMGYTGDLRACTYCCKVVLSYIQQTDMLPSADFNTLQEDLNLCLNDIDNQLESSNSIYESANHGLRNSGSFRRKISTFFREEEFVRTSSRSDLRTFPSVPDIPTFSERKLLTKDSSQLHELWKQMEHPIYGVDFQTHRHVLKTFQNCVSGNEVVDWLITKDKVASRYQAVAIGQALIDAGILESVSRIENVFVDDHIMYKACQVESSNLSEKVTDYEDVEQEPSWVKEIVPDEEVSDDSDRSQEIVDLRTDTSGKDEGSILRSYSTFYLDLNLQNTTASISKVKSGQIARGNKAEKPDRYVNSSSDIFNTEPFKSILHQVDASSTNISTDFLKDALFVNQRGTRAAEAYIAPQGWNNDQNLPEEAGERQAFERLQGTYEMYRKALIHQLLCTEGLSLYWYDIILSIINKVVDVVKPDIINDGDDKDIRKYVHIKTISAGNRSDCQIVNGVVATKNIVHRQMKAYIENPRILLVTCSIVYQRIENKLSSLEPIIMQEKEYLKKVVAKICSYKPDIIIVEKTVSRCAQIMLREMGITVVLNVKRSVIERIARFTQADIVSSLDAQLNGPHLGSCHRFWVHNYPTNNSQSKTLMGFEGCPKHLGCTVLLRGASSPELGKIKRVIKFLSYVEYHWRLERSFLMDEFALPPPLPEEIPLVLSEDSRPSTKPTNHDPSTATPKLSRQVSTSSDRSERKFARIESLEEHVDPLRSTHLVDNRNKFRKKSRMEVAPLPLSNMFRKALNDTILSSSPNIKYNVPFLESETGRVCKLRVFFPDELYWSAHFHKETTNHHQYHKNKDVAHKNKFNRQLADNIEIQPWHPFIFSKLTEPIDSSSVKSMLASFRASGGQIKALCPHEVNKKKQEKSLMKRERSVKGNYSAASHDPSSYWEKKNDVLDPYKHQHLSVLFCSYSYISNNAPNFCVHPWVFNMDFYSQNDITLGEFLERYCFRSTYRCPNESCDTPMTEHVRKFAHGQGCIHITLKKLEKPIPTAQSAIILWSWCHRCRQVTPLAPMSIDTWSLSFAKYLELRFHGNIYNSRMASGSCNHTLHHDFYQYFGYKDIVASFKYSRISLLEVAIPAMLVKIHDNAHELSDIIDEVKKLTIKGYSIYSCVLEKLCTLRENCFGTPIEAQIQKLLVLLNEERNMLRERIGEIQVRLTSPIIENSSTNDLHSSSRDFAVICCELNDMTCYLKQIISETVVSWNNRIQEFISSKRREDKVNRRQALVSVSSQGSLNNMENSGAMPYPEMVSMGSHSSSPLNHTLDIENSFTPSDDLRSRIFLKLSSQVSAESSISKDMSCSADEVDVSETQQSSPSICDPENFKSKAPIKRKSGLIHRNASIVVDAMEAALSENAMNENLENIDQSKSEENEITNLENQNQTQDASVEDQFHEANPELVKNNDEECRRTIEFLERLQEDGNFRRISNSDPIMDNLSSSSTKSIAVCESVGMAAAEGVECVSNESFTVLRRCDAEEPVQEFQGVRPKKETHSHERSKSDGDKLFTSQCASSSNDVDSDCAKIPQSSTTPIIKISSLQANEKERKVGGTMKNLIYQFLSGPLSSPVESPFLPTMHFLLKDPCAANRKKNIPIIVYDEEPSSVIAYTLASDDYDNCLQNLVAQLISAQHKDIHNSSPQMQRKENSKENIIDVDDDSVQDSAYTPKKNRKGQNNAGKLSKSPDTQYVIQYSSIKRNSIEIDEDLNATFSSSQETDKNKDKIPNHHIEIQFSDLSANFYCKIYFAEQFRMLRKLIFPDGEERFIRSLARCRQWKAHGGKSGSIFCKTHDDRFILKQMSKLEVQSFVVAAASYFRYVHKAANEQKPTVLAKIFGVYHIVYKNTLTNTASKLHLLVMENLFYSRKITRKFDLKGSERNRLVNTAGKEESELVLLDENLLKMTCDCPLYIKPHTKTVLTMAIQNDSEFLSSQLVMDYSLLVGLDEESNELVVGIIDYIRTFTWDKKLEMVVKTFGNQGKMPTVVYPELYRKRFCEAMDRYFLMVPDRWNKFGRGINN